MKRLLSALLTMLMLLALLPVIAEEAMPAEKETAQVLGETWYGQYNIRIYDDKTCVIVRILAREKFSELDIPEMLGEYKVVGIGDKAASSNNYLTKVSIPDSVVYIGNEAFKNCTKLAEVKMGNNVVFIGESAFYSCKSLTVITLPEKVSAIMKYAFLDCDSLTNIVIPDSVEKLGTQAFSSCKSLQSVDVIGDVVFIDNDVFYQDSYSSFTVSVTENSLVHLYCDAWDIPYVLK